MEGIELHWNDGTVETWSGIDRISRNGLTLSVGFRDGEVRRVSLLALRYDRVLWEPGTVFPNGREGAW